MHEADCSIELCLSQAIDAKGARGQETGRARAPEMGREIMDEKKRMETAGIEGVVAMTAAAVTTDQTIGVVEMLGAGVLCLSMMLRMCVSCTVWS